MVVPVPKDRLVVAGASEEERIAASEARVLGALQASFCKVKEQASR